MVDLLTTLLEIEGYEVVTFMGGADVLPFIQREDPEVIVLDINLDDLGSQLTNGFDLLAAMRNNEDLCHIRVIVSSGMNYQEESKTAGAVGFVMKPYMPDDLLDMIKANISNI
jgi:CheY-like chemotaxis protein